MKRVEVEDQTQQTDILKLSYNNGEDGDYIKKTNSS